MIKQPLMQLTKLRCTDFLTYVIATIPLPDLCNRLRWLCSVKYSSYTTYWSEHLLHAIFVLQGIELPSSDRLAEGFLNIPRWCFWFDLDNSMVAMLMFISLTALTPKIVQNSALTAGSCSNNVMQNGDDIKMFPNSRPPVIYKYK